LRTAGERAGVDTCISNRQGLTTHDVSQNCIPLQKPAWIEQLTPLRTAQMAEPSSRLHPTTELADYSEHDLDDEALTELSTISLCEFLDQDPRPTFVLDLDSDHLDYGETKQSIRPIFCNNALRLHDRLLDHVTGLSTQGAADTPHRTSFNKFKAWATGVSDFDDSRDVFPQTFLYEGLLWTGSTTRQRWRLVSGIKWHEGAHDSHGELYGQQHPFTDATVETKAQNEPAKITSPAVATTATVIASEPQAKTVRSDVELTVRSSTLVSSAPTYPEDKNGRTSNPPTSGSASNDTSGSGASIPLASPAEGVPDWTVENPRGVLTEHMIFARNVNWSATPLGPMSSWSIQFREIANLLMSNPHPAVRDVLAQCR
jgi:hypothetical protein